MADDGQDEPRNPWREWNQDPRPWYVKEGYESEEAFWEGLRRDEEFWNPSLRGRRARETKLARPDAPERPALDYGVAIARMAQMLVNRGLAAVARERGDAGATSGT